MRCCSAFLLHAKTLALPIVKREENKKVDGLLLQIGGQNV